MFIFKNYIKKSVVRKRITELEKVRKEIIDSINYNDNIQRTAGLMAKEKELQFCINEYEKLIMKNYTISLRKI